MASGYITFITWDFPGGTSSLKKKKKSLMQEIQEMLVWSLGGEGPLEKEMATHWSVLPEKLHGQRHLVGYSPWGHKELNTT